VATAAQLDSHEPLPDWGMRPSPFDWQIVVWGGTSPRTGFPQEAQGFQFFKKHYSLERVIARARDMAEVQHRLFFAVRDTDGTVVHVGRNDAETRIALVRQSYLQQLDKGLRKFAQENR
jgi:hypothetical protein